MKKIILPLTLLVMIFALVACNGSNTASTVENAAGTTAGTPNGDRQFNMPTNMKLLLGTVKLDETDYAVDAEQASELLPLWKALRSLSESDTTAQVELDALVTQIQETMTPEQISAIDNMNLTMQDTASVMQTLGIETSNFGGFGDITPEMQATMEAARASGDFPGGGPGGDFPGGGPGGGGPGGGQGFGGGFGGAEMDPTARETAIAERGGTRGAGFGLNTDLLDAIIQFLEAKIAR